MRLSCFKNSAKKKNSFTKDISYFEIGADDTGLITAPIKNIKEGEYEIYSLPPHVNLLTLRAGPSIEVVPL